MASLRVCKDDIVTLITTRRPIRESRLRKSLAESLPPAQRSRKRKRRVAEEVLYPIHGIVAEREGKYGLEYLIDWEDDQKTGEKFEKSWQPKCNATPQAITEWEAEKRCRSQVRGLGGSGTSIDESSLSSEPASASKRQRRSQDNKDLPSNPPCSSLSLPYKHPRKASSVHSVRFSIFQVEDLSSNFRDVVDDSFEGDKGNDSNSCTLQVEIPICQNFDRDTYFNVSCSSSQPTLTTESQKSSYTPPIKKQQRAARYDGEGIIPDSQELTGSSSYRPSESVTTWTDLDTRPNTTIIGGQVLGTLRNPALEIPESPQPDSDICSVLEGHCGQIRTDRRRYRLETCYFGRGRKETYSSEQEPLLSSEGSLPDTRPSSNEALSGQEAQNRGTLKRSLTSPSLAPVVTSRQGSILDPLDSGSERIRFIETSCYLSESRTRQPCSPEVAQGEDSIFQTRVSFVRESSTVDRDESSTLISGSIISQSKADVVQNSSLPSENLISKVAPDFSQRNCVQQQHSGVVVAAASSEGDWQAKQIVPTTSSCAPSTASGPSDFKIYQEAAPSCTGQIEASQEQISLDYSGQPALTQIDINSQDSPSRVHRSQSTSTQITQAAQKGSPIPRSKSPENIIASFGVIGEVVYDPSLSVHQLSLQASDLSESYVSNSSGRSSTPLCCDMVDGQDKGASPEMTVTELLKQKRTEARAAAAERAMRSPPVIPPKVSTPPPQDASTQLLPVRENLVGSLGQNVTVEIMPSNNELLRSSPSDILGSPNLKPKEHIVLLPIASMVRQVYEATIKNCRREIRALLNGEQNDPAVLERLDAMIEELKLLIDHQDLIMDISATQEASDDLQAKWTETCSSKCLFLRELLDAIRSHEKHIVVLARPGHILDILEVLFRVNKYAYQRLDRPGRPDANSVGPLRVTVLPTGLDVERYIVDPVDAVIAFDETFRVSNCYSKILRTQSHDPKKLLPLVSLVVTNSVESIELCLSKSLGPMERRLLLVQYITQTVSNVGILDPELPEPEQAAAAVARYLAGDLDNDPSWPLPENYIIPGVEDAREEPTFQPSDPTIQSQNPQLTQGLVSQGAMKRTFGVEATSSDEVDSTKRMRMTPAPGEVGSGSEATHISDSVGYSTKPNLASTENALLAKITELESRIQGKEGMEAELRRTIKDLESDLEDQIMTIRKILPKFLQALNDRGRFESERDGAKSQVTVLTERLEARNTEVLKLNEVKEALEIELTATRTALTKSTVPEAAELARAKANITTLQADKERLEKRISSMQRDFEFTRESYQKASSAAAELGNELSALKEDMANLQRKASENVIRVAEIQRSNQTKEREARIEELEGQLRDRELELWRKHEELKAKTNGRRETRGTSVPQSPRMGSGAMSPRAQYARPASRSRQNSPAPGDVAREGYRDPILFPQSGHRGTRWEHLM